MKILHWKRIIQSWPTWSLIWMIVLLNFEPQPFLISMRTVSLSLPALIVNNKNSEPPFLSVDRSRAWAWIMDMRLKLAANAKPLRNEEAKMICMKSRLERCSKRSALSVYPLNTTSGIPCLFKLIPTSALVVKSRREYSLANHPKPYAKVRWFLV